MSDPCAASLTCCMVAVTAAARSTRVVRKSGSDSGFASVLTKPPCAIRYVRGGAASYLFRAGQTVAEHARHASHARRQGELQGHRAPVKSQRFALLMYRELDCDTELPRPVLSQSGAGVVHLCAPPPLKTSIPCSTVSSCLLLKPSSNSFSFFLPSFVCSHTHH